MHNSRVHKHILSFYAAAIVLTGGSLLYAQPTPIVPSPGPVPYGSVGTEQLQDGGVTSPKIAAPTGPAEANCGYDAGYQCAFTVNGSGQVLAITNVAGSASVCEISGDAGIVTTCGSSYLGIQSNEDGIPVVTAAGNIINFSYNGANTDGISNIFTGNGGFEICWTDAGSAVCTVPIVQVNWNGAGGGVTLGVTGQGVVNEEAETINIVAGYSYNEQADINTRSMETETDTVGSYTMDAGYYTVDDTEGTLFYNEGHTIDLLTDGGAVFEEELITGESVLVGSNGIVMSNPSGKHIWGTSNAGQVKFTAGTAGGILSELILNGTAGGAPVCILSSSGPEARTLITTSGDAGVDITSTGSGPLNLYAVTNMNLLVDAGSISIQATDAPNPPGLTLNNDGVGSAALSSGGVGAATYITAYGDGGIQEDSVSGGYSLTSTGGAGIQVYETGIAIDFTEDGGTINIETLNPSGQGVGLSETQSQISLSATDGGNAASIALNRNGNLEMIASGQYQAPGWNKACTFASSTTCTATGFRSGCTVNTWGWNTSDGLTNPAWCSCTSGTCTCTATTPNSGTIGVSCP